MHEFAPAVLGEIETGPEVEEVDPKHAGGRTQGVAEAEGVIGAARGAVAGDDFADKQAPTMTGADSEINKKVIVCPMWRTFEGVPAYLYPSSREDTVRIIDASAAARALELLLDRRGVDRAWREALEESRIEITPAASAGAASICRSVSAATCATSPRPASPFRPAASTPPFRPGRNSRSSGKYSRTSPSRITPEIHSL